MNKMFGKLTDDGLESSGDVLGGGGLLDTGIYTGKVKLAYVSKALNSDAHAINVIIEHNGREIRDKWWIINKAGENFYPDKNDASKKRPLPGFSMAEDLCLLTTGEPLAEQDVQEKVVKLYSFEERKEVPQNVPVLIDVLGKDVTVAVVRQIVNKREQTSTGDWVNTDDTREENVIDKIFDTDSLRTVTEIREEIEEPSFYHKWEKKNSGTPPRNRAKKGEGKSGAPGRPGASSDSSVTTTKKKSLFPKK